MNAIEPIIEVQNLIGGQFAAAHSGKWLECPDPRTGLTRTRVPDSDALDVVRAVQAANKAFAAWSREDRRSRALKCAAIADQLQQRQNNLSEAVSVESGVIRAEAERSVSHGIKCFRFFGDLLAGSLRQSEALNENAAKSGWAPNQLPIGLVAVIAPAYDPFYALALRVAAALAAGNVVIAKASSAAPQVAGIFSECLNAAGLPPGTFNVIQGRGEQIGKAIVQHPGTSTLAFAGRTSVGRAIQILAADFLKSTRLSMSASNPILIFDGIDLEKAASQVARLTLTSEQPIHLRATRVLVQQSVYKKFIETFESVARGLIVGDPLAAGVRVGPLARARDQLRFNQAIEGVLAEKGSCLVGGVGVPESLPSNLSGGQFVRPTVIYDLGFCTEIQQEEVIGPLALVESFKYPHDAIKFANNSPLGLAAFVFHSDSAMAQTIASRLEAGRIFIDRDHAASGSPDRPNLPETPMDLEFGGLKLSANGGEGGLQMMSFFSRQSVILKADG